MGLRHLTGRELEVVRHAAHGLTSAQTAKRLLLSTETIKSHRRHIIQKLQARNMMHAVAMVCMNRPDLIRASKQGVVK